MVTFSALLVSNSSCVNWCLGWGLGCWRGFFQCFSSALNCRASLWAHKGSSHSPIPSGVDCCCLRLVLASWVVGSGAFSVILSTSVLGRLCGPGSWGWGLSQWSHDFPTLVSSKDLASGWFPEPPLEVEGFFPFRWPQLHGFQLCPGGRGSAALLSPSRSLTTSGGVLTFT